jgi:hypothetical protein
MPKFITINFNIHESLILSYLKINIEKQYKETLWKNFLKKERIIIKFQNQNKKLYIKEILIQ